MKKSLLFILVFPLLLSLNANSQSTYLPLLDSINRWIMAADFLPIAPESFSPCTYPLDAWGTPEIQTVLDTQINSLSYKKVMSLTSGCTIGFIREDTSLKKIFFVDNNLNPEVLLYDFSMQIGDSINIQFYSPGIYWDDGEYFLDSIGTATILSQQRRILHLNCHNCSNQYTMSWIEGIGNLANPIYTLSANYNNGSSLQMYGCYDFPHPLSSFVACFEHNQKIYFDTCAYNTPASLDSCHYDYGGGINDPDVSSMVHAYPVPSNNLINFQFNQTYSHEIELKIYDYTGNLRMAEKLDKSNIFNRGALSTGIYLYELKFDDGKVAFGKLIFE